MTLDSPDHAPETTDGTTTNEMGVVSVYRVMTGKPGLLRESGKRMVRRGSETARSCIQRVPYPSTPLRYRDAASAGESDKPAKTTTRPYRLALEQLWVIEPLPAWAPTRNRLRRLAAAPVHQLADPALAARLLGVDTEALVDGAAAGPPIPRDGTLLGALFESLVTLSIRTYAQASEARVGHLRTRGGEHQIDLVIERRDGRIVALEVKLSATLAEADTRHLRWLADRIGPDLLDACVITTGQEAYRRADGIGVIPAGLLTA